jgi:hypothetical protein
MVCARSHFAVLRRTQSHATGEIRDRCQRAAGAAEVRPAVVPERRVPQTLPRNQGPTAARDLPRRYRSGPRTPAGYPRPGPRAKRRRGRDQRSGRAHSASPATLPWINGNSDRKPSHRHSRAVPDDASNRPQSVTRRQGAVDLAKGQRPLRQSAKRASGEVNLYSGIQTPKKLNPNWLNCWLQNGVSL